MNKKATLKEKHPTNLLIFRKPKSISFLKYCPYKRDRRHHALVRDMSAGPLEILNLRFKDINSILQMKESICRINI